MSIYIGVLDKSGANNKKWENALLVTFCVTYQLPSTVPRKLQITEQPDNCYVCTWLVQKTDINLLWWLCWCTWTEHKEPTSLYSCQCLWLLWFSCSILKAVYLIIHGYYLVGTKKKCHSARYWSISPWYDRQVETRLLCIWKHHSR